MSKKFRISCPDCGKPIVDLEWETFFRGKEVGPSEELVEQIRDTNPTCPVCGSAAEVTVIDDE